MNSLFSIRDKVPNSQSTSKFILDQNRTSPDIKRPGFIFLWVKHLPNFEVVAFFSEFNSLNPSTKSIKNLDGKARLTVLL